MITKIANQISIIAIMLLVFAGCQKDLTVSETTSPSQKIETGQYYTPSKEFLASLDALSQRGKLQTRTTSDCNWIDIPAGSTDVLAKAVNDVCAGGVIYFKSGTHTENNPITITKSVKIIGEAGAILKVKSKISPTDTITGAWTINPFFHFLNAPKSLVQDLDIQSFPADGSTAILMENSNESAVMRSKFSKFQSAVLVEKSDAVAIMRNTIVSTTYWKTGEVADAESIVIVNGKSAYISDNDVTGAIFGIWPCDKWGTVERNYTHNGNYLGIILCKVPAGSYILPDNRIIGAAFSSTGTKVLNNKSTDNDWGILVIDGSNNALIVNNELARNNSYDLELAGDSYRFGFLTPSVSNIVVNAGAFQNIKIKDCGRNDQVTGGVKVNTAVDVCN